MCEWLKLFYSRIHGPIFWSCSHDNFNQLLSQIIKRRIFNGEWKAFLGSLQEGPNYLLTVSIEVIFNPKFLNIQLPFLFPFYPSPGPSYLFPLPTYPSPVPFYPSPISFYPSPVSFHPSPFLLIPSPFTPPPSLLSLPFSLLPLSPSL